MTIISLRLRKNDCRKYYFGNRHNPKYVEVGCLNFEAGCLIMIVWGSLPQNGHNGAAYLKTNAACLKIKKWGSLPQIRYIKKKVAEPASKPLNNKKNDWKTYTKFQKVMPARWIV